ncbi:hypothetical protein [Vibrio agarivorans]|uniref:hypothetical protein n=1 Tax=Vibrio agarivorans TaxID=153622 RepID=UPI0025B4264F|nr:hypothetical protein [Vibrio agarivorans]MDN3661143.1 hypothetical protein [Vibrio agarivorans]
MSELKIDLSDLRCPDALIRARAAVKKLLSQSCDALHICSIEPSLLRDLEYANAHEDWNLAIEQMKRPVPEVLQKKWNEDDHSEIYEGIVTLNLISLRKV